MARSRGKARASAIATRDSPGGQGCIIIMSAEASPSARGRAVNHSHGNCGIWGQTGHGGAPALPPQVEARTAEMAHEFIVALPHRPCSWLRLPNPFKRVMEDIRPSGLWVWANGGCNFHA